MVSTRITQAALLLCGTLAAPVVIGDPIAPVPQGVARAGFHAGPPELTALIRNADQLQAEHRFEEAEQLLAAAIERAPREPQARLMRAQLRVAQGNARGALFDCLAAVPALQALAASGCVAQARAALGDAPAARELIERALAGADQGSATRSWAAGIAADIAEQQGDIAAAQRWHALALADAAGAHYPQAAYRAFVERRQLATAVP